MNSRYCYSRLEQTSTNPATVEHYTYNPNAEEDPINMCLFSDVDKSLTGGVLGYRYGPSNENCQLLLADRCAQNWDAVCDVAAANNNAMFPNTATIRGNSMANPAEIQGGSTVGSQLLHNAAQRRFCVFQNCSVQQFPFDPHKAGLADCDTHQPLSVRVHALVQRRPGNDRRRHAHEQVPRQPVCVLRHACRHLPHARDVGEKPCRDTDRRILRLAQGQDATAADRILHAQLLGQAVILIHVYQY